MDKYQKLKLYFQKHKQVLVAFSGGCDSAFVLKAALDAIGKENVLGVTALSASFPEREKEIASRVAQEIGASHCFIESEETSLLNYKKNDHKRCFYCKEELYSKLKKVAEERKYSLIVNGANLDDKQDYRPGQKAAMLLDVHSPLQDFFFTKQDVRDKSKELGLSIWDKPASPCLASRIPYFQEVTTQKLKQIEKAEKYLHGLGFKNFRVRHHGDLARIELKEEEMKNLFSVSLRESILEYFESLGFLYISLDLRSFKSGNMNRKIKNKAKLAK